MIDKRRGSRPPRKISPEVQVELDKLMAEINTSRDGIAIATHRERSITYHKNFLKRKAEEAKVNDELIQLCDRLKKLGDTSTADQFPPRLETMIILYGYLEKRFEERFPEKYKVWVDKNIGEEGFSEVK